MTSENKDRRSAKEISPEAKQAAMKWWLNQEPWPFSFAEAYALGYDAGKAAKP